MGLLDRLSGRVNIRKSTLFYYALDSNRILSFLKPLAEKKVDSFKLNKRDYCSLENIGYFAEQVIIYLDNLKVYLERNEIKFEGLFEYKEPKIGPVDAFKIFDAFNGVTNLDKLNEEIKNLQEYKGILKKLESGTLTKTRNEKVKGLIDLLKGISWVWERNHNPWYGVETWFGSENL